MTWSYEQAIKHVAAMFPDREPLVEDGRHEYVVGTVENETGEIEASFRLRFVKPGIGESDVAEITVAPGSTLCGPVSFKDTHDIPLAKVVARGRAFVPISIRKAASDLNGQARVSVGDYEIMVPVSSIFTNEG